MVLWREMLLIIFLLGFNCAFCCGARLELLPDFIDVLNGSNVDCYKESRVFLDSLENMTLWAYEMWESSARSSFGVLHGNSYQLGDFDECLQVSGPFPTQYCLVQLHLELPEYLKQRYKYLDDSDENSTLFNKINYNWDPSLVPRNILNVGLCLPASCGFEDLERALNYELSKNKYSNEYNVSYRVAIPADRCQGDRNEEEFTFGDISFCFCVVLLFTLVLFSTIYDTRYGNRYEISEKRNSDFDKFMLCFSLKRNFPDLNKLNDNNPALRILYGLRTLCICMIIIDHRIANFVSGPIMNKEFVEKASKTLATQMIIFNGDVFVDSFFVLSGLLVTYTLLCIFEKRMVSPLIIALARYIRLTPVYAMVVFFFATLFYKTGSGPLWRIMIEPEVLDCQKNWWVSILYLGNYVNVENMCIIYSWYLPCDFHFLLLSIPLIMLIKKNKAIGLSLLSTLFVISILIPGIITVIYQFPALSYFQMQAPGVPIFKKDFQFNTTYITSHCRFSAYAIGMFTGLIYYRLRKKPVNISGWKSHFLTVFGLFLIVVSLCCGLPFYNEGYEYNAIEAGAYAGLHRPAWALGTSMLLLNSSYGGFGIMRWILSWRLWVPLSKLVYGAYLTHLCFQLRSVAVLKTPQFLEPFTVVELAVQDLVLSFFAALVLNLCVETPARKMLKIVVDGKIKKEEESSEM